MSGCALLPLPSSTATPGEQMPGFAGVWLTSEPPAPASPVDVAMTSPDDPGIRFAYTFEEGRPLRGDFATSQGRYTMSALGGACTLPIVLGAEEAANVVLTLGPGSGCSLAIVRRGAIGDPAMRHPDGGVLLTNHGVGDATPRIEPDATSP